jgi:hypothetical protein
MSAVSGPAVTENFIREKIMVEAIIQLLVMLAILYGCVFHSSGTTLAYVLCAAWMLTIMGSLRIFTSAIKDIIGYHED